MQERHCGLPPASGPIGAHLSPNACVKDPTNQRPHVATACPNECPFPTGGILNVRLGCVRATITVNAGPAEDLLEVECLRSYSTYKAFYLPDFMTKYRPSIPSSTAPKYAHP
ncbi:hypothetical protein CRG98_034385 [Punica granatum]|uniref:Uncharacterized protein n=1 Tax=Punica granatum TaxID=22663 RepID=A0A2I0IMH9_PUNGR|nr:hypothetical protein CRG98_034385 [Punica granatum]